MMINYLYRMCPTEKKRQPGHAKAARMVISWQHDFTEEKADAGCGGMSLVFSMIYYIIAGR